MPAKAAKPPCGYPRLLNARLGQDYGCESNQAVALVE
jgi:hypothetical protein